MLSRGYLSARIPDLSDAEKVMLLSFTDHYFLDDSFVVILVNI